MKSIIRAAIVISIALTTTYSTCKKEDNNSLASQATALTQTAATGKWKVTYFFDNSTDHTSYFTGYEFTFNSGGTVSASKSGSPTITGTWSSGNDDSTVKLFLNFGTTTYFIEMNNDWQLVQQTSTLVH